MKITYLSELSLEEGFVVLDAPKKDRLVNGREVSACSGFNLFKQHRHGAIRCWQCGVLADRWIVEKDGRDLTKTKPIVNLYAYRDGKLILMTRDHIIPKSLGGVDHVNNLRPGCADCNSTRGNEMTAEDLKFRLDHPELVNRDRFKLGKKAVLNAITSEHGGKMKFSKLISLLTPFAQAEEIDSYGST